MALVKTERLFMPYIKALSIFAESPMKTSV